MTRELIARINARLVMRRFDGLRNGRKIPVRLVEKVGGIPIWISDINQFIVVASHGKQKWLSWSIEQARNDAGIKPLLSDGHKAALRKAGVS